MDVALIPAYDNEGAIGDVVRGCARHVDAVIVCDDGSSDRTAERARECGAAVISHGSNRGKGAALRTLFEEARRAGADRACTIDGDGQFDPSEIPRLLGAQKDSGADVVVGYRFDDRGEMPGYRRLGNRLLDTMTNMAVDVPVRDTQSGFRVYSKGALEAVRFEADGFAADSEILMDAARKNLPMAERKITVSYGGDSIHSKNPISHGSGVFGALLEHVVLRHPLKLLGAPGLALLALGVAYSAVVVSIFNDIGYFSVPSTLVALGALVCGLMLLFMSVVLYAIRISGRS